MWENGLKLCRELAKIYETRLIDFAKLSNILVRVQLLMLCLPLFVSYALLCCFIAAFVSRFSHRAHLLHLFFVINCYQFSDIMEEKLKFLFSIL